MYGLKPRAIDKNFPQRRGLGNFQNIPAGEFQRHIGLWSPVWSRLIKIRAQCDLDHIQETADDPVLVQITDILQRGFNLCNISGAGSFAVPCKIRVKAGCEQFRQIANNARILRQRFGHIVLREGDSGLTQIF